MRIRLVTTAVAAGVFLASAASAEHLQHLKRPLVTRAEHLQHLKRPLLTRAEHLQHLKRPLVTVE